MHFDHPIFIVLIAIAGFLRWLSQRAQKTRESDADTTSTSAERRREPEQTEEEKIRRFLEALGQPTTAKPPAKIKPRRVETKRALLPPRPLGPVMPPLTTRPPESTDVVPPPLSAPPPLVRLEPTAFAPVARKATVFEVREMERQSPDDLPTSVRRKTSGAAAVPPAIIPRRFAGLTTADGLREAIVLREIFGPPRGLEIADRF